MQPSYAAADIRRHHHHHNQQLVQNNECCSSVFPNPSQNRNHHCQSEFVHSVPITCQLFHQQQQHFEPPFPQPEEKLHPQMRQQHHQPPPHRPIFPVKFKLGVHQNGVNNKHNPPQLWHPDQEDPASGSIKEPFWKQLSRRDELCEEEQHIEGDKNKYCKQVNAQQLDEDNERCKDLDNKYRLFGELEAIYSLANVCENDQTASGSALTGEDLAKNACPLSIMPFRAVDDQNAGIISAANAGIGVDHGSENSIEEEEAASLKKSRKRMMRKRKLKENLGAMAGFIENLVKQVIDHQEILHSKFLQVIDRMDKERTEREQEWRRQEVVKYNKEAIARAHEQSLASSRDAQIVSYIEEITGQSMDLPARKTHLLLQPEIHQTPTK